MLADPALGASAPLQVGAPFGAYDIQALIGSGGMGEVYRARDPRLGRDVAIKVLPDGWTNDPDHRARFDREAHVLATLNHPHIGAIYGVEDVGERRGLILELVEGPTLADRLRGGPIPLTEALTIARQIADALAAAHEHGIVHRDLKPANIKVTANATVKVLDFGLAKFDHADASNAGLSESPTIARDQTRAGAVLGTAAYMSPEQARGQPVDARTDIWGFGCVLYEMLTGRSAFGAETTSDTIAAVLTRDPDWRTLSARTPAPVRDALRRCLRRDPAQRIHSIADVRLVIDEVFSPARRITARRVIVWSASAGCLLTALLAGTLWRMNRPASPAVLESAPFTTFLGVEAAPAFSPDGSRIAFVWDQGSGADLYVKLVGGSDPLRLTARPSVSSPTWSPEGREIAFLRRTGTSTEREVSIVPALGGSERRIATTRASANGTGVAWAADGRHLIVVDKDAPDGFDALFLLSTDTGERRRLTAPGALDEHHPVLSPDGRTVALIRNAMNLRVRDVYLMPAQGGQARRLTASASFITGLDWSADGRSIIFAATTPRSSRLWRAPVAGGAPEPLAAGDGAIDVAVARAGARLAYDVVFEDANIWRAAGPAAARREPPARFIASTREEWFPAYSPAGRGSSSSRIELVSMHCGSANPTVPTAHNWRRLPTG